MPLHVRALACLACVAHAISSCTPAATRPTAAAKPRPTAAAADRLSEGAPAVAAAPAAPSGPTHASAGAARCRLAGTTAVAQLRRPLVDGALMLNVTPASIAVAWAPQGAPSRAVVQQFSLDGAARGGPVEIELPPRLVLRDLAVQSGGVVLVAAEPAGAQRHQALAWLIAPEGAGVLDAAVDLQLGERGFLSAPSHPQDDGPLYFGLPPVNFSSDPGPGVRIASLKARDGRLALRTFDVSLDWRRAQVPSAALDGERWAMLTTDGDGGYFMSTARGTAALRGLPAETRPHDLAWRGDALEVRWGGRRYDVWSGTGPDPAAGLGTVAPDGAVTPAVGRRVLDGTLAFTIAGDARRTILVRVDPATGRQVGEPFDLLAIDPNLSSSIATLVGWGGAQFALLYLAGPLARPAIGLARVACDGR